MPQTHLGLPEYTLEPDTIDADERAQTWTESVTGNIGETAPVRGQKVSAENWDSAVWARAVLNQTVVQASKAKLDRRLAEFLRMASPEEQTQYEETRTKVLDIMKQAKAAHEIKPPGGSDSEKSLVESIKARWRVASETAYEYTQIMDVLMGQAPEYVALAYGAVKILLVVQVNYEEMKQNVEEYMYTIRTKFCMIDHLTTYSPSGQLVAAVGKAYDGFQRFLAKALKFYTRSRFRNAFRALKKPWKRLEPIVKSIEQSYAEIIDIVHISNHFTGQVILARVSKILEFIEGDSIKFAKQSDIIEASDLFRQRIEARMEQPCVTKTSSPRDQASRATAEEGVNDPSDLDRHLAALFIDLTEFDEARAQQQSILEQVPEMRRYRSTQRNILRVDKVIDWVESKTSQLLWIDGNGILQKETFDLSFVAPLLIFGEGNHESCLVLRHFCDNGQLTKPSNYRTLVQALLRQLLKQRPEIWAIVHKDFNGDSASNIYFLWSIFAKALKETKAQCTFIIIDSIDFLVSEVTYDGIEERDIVLRELSALVNDFDLLIKVLLTASLCPKPTSACADSASAMQPVFSALQPRPGRTLSTDILQNQLALVPHKLAEIQERRCRSIQFAELPLLYAKSSTIYARENEHLQAYVVSECWGMDPRPFNTYSPFVLRTWAVSHNGTHFVKRFYDLSIHQFAGEMNVKDLKYVPAGYLEHEHLQRLDLIRRGKRYWELGSEVRCMEHHAGDVDSTSWRIVIDQHLQPSRTWPLQELDIELDHVLHSNLKPLFAITCPPIIPAYCLHDNIWRELDINNIRMPDFRANILKRLYFPPNGERILRATMVPYQNSLYIPSNPTLILLHGGPGVGKTTTAEYLAEHTRRPLLSTTSAAIIKHEREAETTFKQILHQATRWKAILLLENVELIFSEERGDRHGSSAILILKALETHHGLVFLTTDRIGLLVSSLISRINIPLELFPLPHEAKMMILRNLVEDHTLVLDREEGEELLQLARDHWKEMDDDQLNGSDIQNAFRNASRMTMTAMEKAETQRPNSLWWEYLKDSLQLQIERQECLQDIKGQPEEDVALMSRWRRPFKFQRSQLHARQVPGQPYLGNPGHRLSPDSLAHAPSLEATQEDIDT